MIKYGLKLWSNNEKYISEAEKLYKEKMYDYIELYTIPGTYDKYIKIWRNLNIPFIIHCAHTTHGFNLAIKNKFQNNLKIFSEAKAFCDELNGKYIIFHPGIKGSLENSIRQINFLADKRMLVENKPYVSMSGNACRGSLLGELKAIIDFCKVGFCLDISHAINVAFHLKINYFNYIKKMLSLKPRVIHISDGEIKEKHDKHLNIGRGIFDFRRMKEIIAVSNAQYLTLETDRSGDKLDGFIENSERMKEIIKNE